MLGVSATGISMKLWIYAFVGVLVAKNAFAAPDMLSISIGGEFPDKSPYGNKSTEKPRPTFKFHVPNSGESKELFPEYEVSILRATNEIVEITGRRVFTGLLACRKSEEVALSWVERITPNAIQTKLTQSFKSKASNITARLGCLYPNESPYPVLTLQFRGKEQDKKLKKAWKLYSQKH